MRHDRRLVVLAILLAGCTTSPSGPSIGSPTAPPSSAAAPRLPTPTLLSATATQPPCTAIVVPGAASAPGASMDPTLAQRAYVVIADDFNDAARSGLGKLGDPAATLEARLHAVDRLAAADGCFGTRVGALDVQPNARGAQAGLADASAAIVDQLGSMAHADSIAVLEAGLPALRQRYRAAGQAAASLRSALQSVSFEGWQPMPPTISVGRPIPPAGELWFRSGGWSTSWMHGVGHGSYTLAVDNPWDAFAIGVTVQVWLVAEDGTDYAPPATLSIGSVGPGQSAVRIEPIEVRQGILLDDVLGTVTGAAAWYAVSSDELPGR
jgi:hypothetical protein